MVNIPNIEDTLIHQTSRKVFDRSYIPTEDLTDREMYACLFV